VPALQFYAVPKGDLQNLQLLARSYLSIMSRRLTIRNTQGLHTLAPFPLVSVAIILFIGYLRRDRLRASRT